MASFDRLIRIADRLAQVSEGSPAADRTIHEALGLTGPAPPYTTEVAAALALLPPDFEAEWPVSNAGGEVYGLVVRKGLLDGLPHPHFGQWGANLKQVGLVCATRGIAAATSPVIAQRQLWTMRSSYGHIGAG